MMRRWERRAAALVVAVAAAGAGLTVMRSSAPATPQEIAEAIANADPACRQLVRHRLAVAVAERGAISRRTLDAKMHGECLAAGPQLAAIVRTR